MRKLIALTVLLATATTAQAEVRSKYWKETENKPKLYFKQTSYFKKIPKQERNPKKHYNLVGTVSLKTIYSLLAGEGIKIVGDPRVSLSTSVPLAISTDSTDELLDAFCSGADIWCDYSPIDRTLKVSKTKTFTFDFYPEGKVSVTVGGASIGGSDSGENSDSREESGSRGKIGQESFTYTTTNVDQQTLLAYLQDTLKVPFRASPQGFIQVKLTPSQWRELSSYFAKDSSRREVVDVKVTLLRVDLSKNFQYGIDWDMLVYHKTGAVRKIGASFLLSPITEGDKVALSATTASGDTNLITFLEKFGKVYKVDEWRTQGLTGTPIPFANYQEAGYFTMDVSQGDQSTEISITPQSKIVGFIGSLSVYKLDSGYFVDGAINLSSIYDWLTMTADKITLTYPETTGKKFRIATKLSDLNKTLVVGGFRIRGFENRSKAVPLLHKLPVLGWLFKGKSDLTTNSEFVVVIQLKKAKEGITPDVNSKLQKVINGSLLER